MKWFFRSWAAMIFASVGFCIITVVFCVGGLLTLSPVWLVIWASFAWGTSWCWLLFAAIPISLGLLGLAASTCAEPLIGGGIDWLFERTNDIGGW